MNLHKLIPKKTFCGLFLPKHQYINDKFRKLPPKTLYNMEKEFTYYTGIKTYDITMTIQTRNWFFKEYQINKIIASTYIDNYITGNVINEEIHILDKPYYGTNCKYSLNFMHKNLLELDVDEIRMDDDDGYLNNFDFLYNEKAELKINNEIRNLRFIVKNNIKTI